jgi:beta-glucosidase
VEYLNALQRFLVEDTRLGIPALALGEGLHGYMANEATSFPQAIGLASAWDLDLHERIFQIVAQEMRVRGAHYVLSPVLDLARDPRWGRTEETYGEDPYLVSRLGVAAVRGLQGERFTGAPGKVLATAKHFAAHGQPEGGTNCAPANFAEHTLREEFLAPFQAVVQEASIGSVMASYNEINSIPSHINTWLLQDVLRAEWGFDGFVVSDGWGVDDLYRLHFVAANETEAAHKAFISGVDLELGRCFRHLTELVAAGLMSEAIVDAAVRRVLKVKFMLGLFENPYVPVEQANTVTNCAEHRAVALEAARKSIVLLKNDHAMLPLILQNIRSLAVIGPNAAALRLGGYSGIPRQGISVLEGIRRKVGNDLVVRHAEGCGLTQSTAGIEMWFEDEVLPSDFQEDTEKIAEAVALAEVSDLTLLVLGDNEQTCREGWSVSHLGDRDSLDLPGRQEDLLRSIVATGKPVVLLLLNGRPISIPFAAEHVPAILEGWYLGQEGGTAVAEVLFGDVNPGGKLPITFPRSVGQIPAYYYHKPSARRGYLFKDSAPLYAFGHGLSYTTFSYTNLRLDHASLTPGESTTLHIDLCNTGSRIGDEVVQLYIHDVLSSKVTRPVMRLKGFQRIQLQPGEVRTVSFPIGPDQLAGLNEAMQSAVEPGEFELLVGGSSEATNRISIWIKPE